MNIFNLIILPIFRLQFIKVSTKLYSLTELYTKGFTKYMAGTKHAAYPYGNRPSISRTNSSSRALFIDDEKLKLAANYLMDPSHNSPSQDEDSLKNNATRQHVIDVSTESGKENKGLATEDEFYVLGLPIYRWSKPVQFSVGVGGVFFFYLIYGYMQVRIWSHIICLFLIFYKLAWRTTVMLVCRPS